jgi:phosphoglucomutase
MADQVDRECNRRLFGGFLGWLMYHGRRPGMFGAAISFTGRTRAGQAVLRRAGSQWEVTEDGTTREVTTADVLRMVGEGDFFPRTVDVVPDLAELLFMEAEASHN